MRTGAIILIIVLILGATAALVVYMKRNEEKKFVDFVQGKTTADGQPKLDPAQLIDPKKSYYTLTKTAGTSIKSKVSYGTAVKIARASMSHGSGQDNGGTYQSFVSSDGTITKLYF